MLKIFCLVGIRQQKCGMKQQGCGTFLLLSLRLSKFPGKSSNKDLLLLEKFTMMGSIINQLCPEQLNSIHRFSDTKKVWIDTYPRFKW